MKIVKEIEDTLSSRRHTVARSAMDEIARMVKDKRDQSDAFPDSPPDDSEQWVKDAMPVYSGEIRDIEYLHYAELDATETVISDRLTTEQRSLHRIEAFLDAKLREWWGNEGASAWSFLRDEARKTAVILDGDSLIDATHRGCQIKTYDGGSGPLWILVNSMGIEGIVRADTWEDAYSICEDEIFPEAGETVEAIKKEYGFRVRYYKVVKPLDGSPEREEVESDYVNGQLPDAMFVRWGREETPDPDAFLEHPEFRESFGFRNNGPAVADVHKHCIYQKDLNGESLEWLGAGRIKDWDIVLTIKNPE